MNVRKKQAIDKLCNAVGSVNEVKIQTDIQSLDELSKAFNSTEDKAERKKLVTDFKKCHTEFQKFLESNSEIVNAEVERALLTAAIGGEYVEEETKIGANGRRTYKRKVKKVAPNPSAALSYLQNKDKENWSANPKADPELEDTSEIEEDIYGEGKKA